MPMSLLFLLTLLFFCISTTASTVQTTSHHERNQHLLHQLRQATTFSILEKHVDATHYDTNAPIPMYDHEGTLHHCQVEQQQPLKDSDEPAKAPPLAPSPISPVATSHKEDQLDFLSSFCATFNSGWWQYKWCHVGQITQFHAEKNGQITATQLLGTYNALETQHYLLQHHKHKETKQPTSTTTGSKEEQPVVVQLFDSGDSCPDTKAKHTQRTTRVEFFCCGLAPTQHKKKAMTAHTATIASIAEPTTCMYVLKICTQYACGVNDRVGTGVVGAGDADDGSDVGSGGSGGSGNSARRKNQRNNQSIQSLLAPLNKACFRLQDGWWVYELCLGSHLRQFHVQKASATEGTTTTTHNIVQIHMLGKKNNNANHRKEKRQDHLRHIHIAKEGELVAYEETYDDGELCAITGKHRHATIYFVCTDPEITTSKLLSVEETLTCQYKAVFHTPYLCQHRLFRSKIKRSVAMTCRQPDEEERIQEHR